MSDDLRKLAEAATPGPWVNSRKGIGPRCVSDGQDDGMTLTRIYADFPNDAAFITAASPDVVLGLLDERDDAWAAAKRQCERRAEVAAERDDAHAAVRRLAGALEKQQELYDNKGGIMKSIGLVALADPVVRRIVEGG